MGQLDDIRTRAYNDITGSAFFTQTGLPVVKFDYAIDQQVQEEIQQRKSVCVQVNFCELKEEPKSFGAFREYNFVGTIDVYEVPELNRIDTGWYGADTVAESVAAILQSDITTMDDQLNVPLFHVRSIEFKPINPKSTDETTTQIEVLRWRVTYAVTKTMIGAVLT